MAEAEKKPKLAIAFTSRGNDLFYGLPAYILQQDRVFGDIACLAACSLWGPATERMFQALADKDFDFVHVLDSDVCPHPDTTQALVNHDLDIVSSPIWMYDAATNDLHLNVCRDVNRTRQRYPGKGIEEIYGASFASVVIKKRVFDAFCMAGEKFTHHSPLVSDLPEDRERMPPDAIFYTKALRLGFKCHMDWGCHFGTHHKHVMLNAPFVINLLERYEQKPDQRARAEGVGSPAACAV